MRRNLRFQGATPWVFLLLMLCFSGETAFCRQLMDTLHPQGGRASIQARCTTTLRGWAAYKASRSHMLRPRSELQLSCIHTCVPEKGPQSLWGQSLCLPKSWGGWGPPALPCSPTGWELHCLTEGKLVERYFSTAGQTTSSRNKLFLALGNSFLKKYDLPRTDEACYMRKMG